MEQLVTTEARSRGEEPERSLWIRGSHLLQAFWTLALVSLSLGLVILSFRTPKTARNLRAVALMFAVPSLFSLLSWYGLWQRKLWGWWLACIFDWGLAAVFVYAVVDDGWSMMDWNLVGTTTCSLILPIWLVMPATRNFFLKRNLKQI